jgi:hypothetical protein
MLKEFIGQEARIVVVNGKSYGEVKPGDRLAIPDDDPATWPESSWKDIKPTKKKIETKETD